MSSEDSIKPTFDYSMLTRDLQKSHGDTELFTAVVNAPFNQKLATTLLFLGIIVLLLVDKETGNIDRVALSNTENAKYTTDVSVVPFNDIKIPVSDTENIISKAIKSNKPQDTTDWKFLFTPALTAEQARINQASGGIAYSAVYPLLETRNGGALIFSYYQYQHEIGNAQADFMNHYATIVAKQLSVTTT